MYQTPPEAKEILVKRKSSLCERVPLDKAISGIQELYKEDFEIDLSWNSEQALALAISTRERDEDEKMKAFIPEDETMRTFIQALFGCFESSGMESSLTKIVIQLNHCSKLTDNFLKDFGNSITQKFENLSSFHIGLTKSISE